MTKIPFNLKVSVYNFTINLERGGQWNLLNHRYNEFLTFILLLLHLLPYGRQRDFKVKKKIILSGLNFVILGNVYNTEQIMQCEHKKYPAFELKYIFSTSIQSPLYYFKRGRIHNFGYIIPAVNHLHS